LQNIKSIVGEPCIFNFNYTMHNEELHNLYSSPNIITQMKSRIVRWECYVARVGEERKYTTSWWESLKEGDHSEDRSVDRRMG
jgi:hypothetical protein